MDGTNDQSAVSSEVLDRQVEGASSSATKPSPYPEIESILAALIPPHI